MLQELFWNLKRKVGSYQKNRIKRNTNQKKYLDEIKILMLHTQLVFDLCKSPAVKEKATYTKNDI